MDYKTDTKRVTAIVPAYNEAERIGAVLDVLVSFPGFYEVIVVDDGSTDNTPDIVKKYNVVYIRLKENKGKGYAMDQAVKNAKTDIIFFCDADVKNLTHNTIEAIVSPVLEGRVEMFVGMRSRGIYALSWMISLVPILGGERALTKELWNKLPDWYKHRFRTETGLNFYAKYYGRGFDFKFFPSTQVIKEKKYGFWIGTKHRFIMFYNILSAGFRAEVAEIPTKIAYRRRVYLEFFGSFIGVFIGILFVLAAYRGPLPLLLDFFSGELAEDPSAPFVLFLITCATRVSVNALGVFGFSVLIVNIVVVFLRIKRIKQLSRV
jgi:glycosyltransferase involved in cell wall biosynthesis